MSLGRCLGDFNAGEFGSDYISVKAGEIMTRSRDKLEDKGWVHGLNTSDDEGWFPVAVWQEVLAGSQQHAQPGNPEYAPRDHECQRKSVEEVWVDLVQHSQKSISDRFRDGRKLEETISQLLEGVIDPGWPLFDSVLWLILFAGQLRRSADIVNVFSKSSPETQLERGLAIEVGRDDHRTVRAASLQP